MCPLFLLHSGPSTGTGFGPGGSGPILSPVNSPPVQVLLLFQPHCDKMCSILTVPHREPILPIRPCAPPGSHCALSPSTCPTQVPLCLQPLLVLHRGPTPPLALCHAPLTLPTPCWTPHESHQNLGPLPCLTWAPFCSQPVTGPSVPSQRPKTLTVPHKGASVSLNCCCAPHDHTLSPSSCCAPYVSHCPL